MRHVIGIILSVIGLIAGSDLAQSGALRVSPVLLDIPIPAAAGSIRLRNEADEPVVVQVRALRWTQDGGTDELSATQDVAISPPIFEMKPHATQLVRVVRVSRSQRTNEESYRIFVDEIPNCPGPRGRNIRLAVRHSIPLFFAGLNNSPPVLRWSLQQIDGDWYCVLTNDGGQRVRISNLTIRSGGNQNISLGSGLIGYVLGHSTVRWPIPKSGSRIGPGKSVAISALTDSGPLNAMAIVATSR